MAGKFRDTTGNRSLIQLNPPVPLAVEETERQRPLAIMLKGRMVKVATIVDMWVIEEEWWREKPIERIYYQVVTEDERQVTIFRDMVDNGWYRQDP